jgi:hypothetical protein
MERVYDQVIIMSTLYCIQCLELQPGLLRHVELSSFGATTAAIAEECFAVMLVLRTEAPLLRQVCRKLLIEGLTDVLWHYGQEFEGAAGMLVCDCRFMDLILTARCHQLPQTSS